MNLPSCYCSVVYTEKQQTAVQWNRNPLLRFSELYFFSHWVAKLRTHRLYTLIQFDYIYMSVNTIYRCNHDNSAFLSAVHHVVVFLVNTFFDFFYTYSIHNVVFLLYSTLYLVLVLNKYNSLKRFLCSTVRFICLRVHVTCVSVICSVRVRSFCMSDVTRTWDLRARNSARTWSVLGQLLTWWVRTVVVNHRDWMTLLYKFFFNVNFTENCSLSIG